MRCSMCANAWSHVICRCLRVHARRRRRRRLATSRDSKGVEHSNRKNSSALAYDAQSDRIKTVAIDDAAPRAGAFARRLGLNDVGMWDQSTSPRRPAIQAHAPSTTTAMQNPTQLTRASRLAQAPHSRAARAGSGPRRDCGPPALPRRLPARRRGDRARSRPG